MNDKSKGQSPGSGFGGGSGIGGRPEIDLSELIVLLEQSCEKLLEIIENLDEADLPALCQKLLDLATAVTTLTTSNSESLAEVIVAIETLCAKIEEDNDDQNQTLELIKQCLLDLTKEVECVGEPVGEAEAYLNSDEETELSLSVGTPSGIKIESGAGDGSDAAITAYISACLANGNSVQLSWVTEPGDTGSATLIPGLPGATPFPNFFNGTTTLAGASGKITSMRAQCLGDAETLEALCVHDTKTFTTLSTIANTLQELLQKYCEPSVIDALTCTVCSTGGATPETAYCFNVPRAWVEFDTAANFDQCVTNIAGGPDIEGDYGLTEFTNSLPAGAVVIDNGATYTVYTAGISLCLQRRCITGNVGSISRVCLISQPNTDEPVEKKYLDVLGKYDEPIGNILASIDDKTCDGLAKQCLILEALTTSTCPEPLVTATAQQLTFVQSAQSSIAVNALVNITDITGTSIAVAQIEELTESELGIVATLQNVVAAGTPTFATASKAQVISKDAMDALISLQP